MGESARGFWSVLVRPGGKANGVAGGLRGRSDRSESQLEVEGELVPRARSCRGLARGAGCGAEGGGGVRMVYARVCRYGVWTRDGWMWSRVHDVCGGVWQPRVAEFSRL